MGESGGPIVRGTNYRNGGAHLMMRCIEQRLAPLGSRPAVGAGAVRHAPRREMLKAKIYAPGKIDQLPDWARIPRVVRSRECRVFLDATGFGYGDFWGNESLERSLRHLERLPRNSLKVLLPQALGPFGDIRTKALAKEYFSRFQMIFPRDTVSHNHLIDLEIQTESLVRQTPDIVFGYDAAYEPRTSFHGRVGLIPSGRMQSSTGASAAQLYATIAEELHSLGADCELIVMAPHEDMPIACDVQEIADRPIPIRVSRTPEATLRFIESCDLVVTSRFHGAVAALSRGVVASTLGWSHKYGELLQSVDLAHLDFSAASEPGLIAEEAWAEATDPSRKARLERKVADNRSSVDSMWRDVFAEIALLR